jgi:hypothetical protein
LFAVGGVLDEKGFRTRWRYFDAEAFVAAFFKYAVGRRFRS